MQESALTDQSPAGRYYVLTRSRSVYEIVLSPDSIPRITRYRAGDNAITLDGSPLTGVNGFKFDAVTGEGRISWWKHRAEDRDIPAGTQYAGTHRSTSAVRLILRDGSTKPSIAPSTSPSDWPDDVTDRIVAGGEGTFLDRIRYVLTNPDPDVFERFVLTLAHSKGGRELVHRTSGEAESLVNETASIRDLARHLNVALGPTLVAALGGASSSAAAITWEHGDRPTSPDEVEPRLKLAYETWTTVSHAEGDDVARAWFVGANPWLANHSPIAAIREDRVSEVRRAAQALIDDSFSG